MSKIKIKLCMGTSCYLAGSPRLIDETEALVREKFSDKAEVVPSACMGLCVKNWENPSPPYAKIGDEIIESATVEKIVEVVERA